MALVQPTSAGMRDGENPVPAAVVRLGYAERDCVRLGLAPQREPRVAATDATTSQDAASDEGVTSMTLRKPHMKSAPFLLSFALLMALAACSKQPQEGAPSVSTAPPASAVATPASDPSLPSASVVASAPPTPVDAPASAPAGMPMPSSAAATASGASAP